MNWPISWEDVNSALNKLKYGGVGYYDSDVFCSEQTVAVDWDEGDGSGFFALYTKRPLAAGNRYIVNFNGTEYVCSAGTMEGYAFIGHSMTASDYSYPFTLVNQPSEDGVAVFGIVFTNVSAVTISITEEVIHKIDPEFITDHIPVVRFIGTIPTMGSASELAEMPEAESALMNKVVNIDMPIVVVHTSATNPPIQRCTMCNKMVAPQGTAYLGYEVGIEATIHIVNENGVWKYGFVM